MHRRNTKKPPRASPLRMVIESLETRAMLAGVEPESWSAPGLAPAPLGTGALLSSGVILTCSSPTPGSSGTSSPPAPAAGSGDSQSIGLALPSNSGSGAGSSSTGSGTSNSGGLALPSNSGPGAGSSHSGTGSTSDPNSPVLSSQYTGGSNAGGQGTGTSNSGTLSGSDLWLLYGAGLGAATSSSGAIGGSLSNRLTLLTQYTEGSSAGGQGNGTGGTLSNADLWRLYWSGAGAGSSSSSSDEGSLADDPTLSAQYTGGSGIGRITPLVYQFGSDDGPGFQSGVWTSVDGGVDFVNASDGEGAIPPPPDAGTASVGWFDWFRNLWRSETKPATPSVDQPNHTDIPAVGLPDQLPATRADGTLDPVFNNSVEDAKTEKWSRYPKSLMDQMVLDAAMLGKGIRIIESLGDDRFKGMEKWSYGVTNSDGTRSEVHYVRDPKTGRLFDFKFTHHAERYR